MNKTRWNALVLEAVYMLSDYQGQEVSMYEVAKYIQGILFLRPRWSTIIRHINRVIDEGHLESTPYVRLRNPTEA